MYRTHLLDYAPRSGRWTNHASHALLVVAIFIYAIVALGYGLSVCTSRGLSTRDRAHPVLMIGIIYTALAEWYLLVAVAPLGALVSGTILLRAKKPAIRLFMALVLFLAASGGIGLHIMCEGADMGVGSPTECVRSLMMPSPPLAPHALAAPLPDVGPAEDATQNAPALALPL